jgi:hypothetical protein
VTTCAVLRSGQCQTVDAAWHSVLTWNAPAERAERVSLQTLLLVPVSNQRARRSPPAIAQRYLSSHATPTVEELALIRVRYGAGQIDRQILADIGGALKLPPVSRVSVEVLLKGDAFTGASFEAVLVQAGVSQGSRPPTLTVELSARHNSGAAYVQTYSPALNGLFGPATAVETPCVRAAELMVGTSKADGTAIGNTLTASFHTPFLGATYGTAQVAYADDSGVSRPLQVLQLAGEVALSVSASWASLGLGVDAGGVARVVHYLDV